MPYRCAMHKLRIPDFIYINFRDGTFCSFCLPYGIIGKRICILTNNTLFNRPVKNCSHGTKIKTQTIEPITLCEMFGFNGFQHCIGNFLKP